MHWRQSFLLVVRVALAALLASLAPSFASADEWIQMFSRPSVNEAVALATEHHDRFSADVAVLACDNGWYAVVRGPYPLGAAAGELSRLAGILPKDSFVTVALRCSRTIWSESSASSYVNGAAAADVQAAKDTADSYYRDWSLSNVDALKRIEPMFPDQVLYFGKLTSKADVLAAKIEFVVRWPERLYVVRPGTVTASCAGASGCIVRGIVDWRVYSPERDSTSIGSATFELGLASVEPPVLSSESSSVLSRQIFNGRIGQSASASAGPDQVVPPETASASPQVSSGSGFAISTVGAVVTNAHVVNNCKSIELTGVGPASLLAIDTERDLAVVRASHPLTDIAVLQTQEPRLGQQIVALGFPLSDFMGNALTVSPGVVGSLSGFGGERSNYSVSANIQPGNSGGPILDLDGDVVGVAVAKFDEAKMLQETGTTAGSIGFAIPTSTLLDFLAPFKFESSGAQVDATGDVEKAAARGRNFTFQITCKS